MSKSLSSPTAHLLRTSRLFSLPKPLPAPPLDSLTTTGVFKSSPTATRPYPTHQAISTPAPSLSRGDWGLKRPLPGRRTRHSSTPTIRVEAQDTSAHITDFNSAADHVLTARKWAEMGVPMIDRSTRTTKTSDGSIAPMSVYESHLDNTDPHALPPVEMEQGRGSGGRRIMEEVKPRQRWKYDGPWIAGMQEGEFNQFMSKRIDSKKEAWRDFLRTSEAESKLAQVQRHARAEGNPLSPSDIAQLRLRLRPTDAQLTEVEKTLRDDHAKNGLSSTLSALIADFLDLPSADSNKDSEPLNLDVRSEGLSRALASTMASDCTGPPSTHPAAGLSHLRTNAIMENHPIHGPQAHRSPIEARVVRPRTSVGQTVEYNAKLGVGGFVANDPNSATNNPGVQPRAYDPAGDMAHRLDPDLPGGNKVWVHPQSAFVDESGRVHLEVLRGDGEAVAVRKGEVQGIHEAKRGVQSPMAPSTAARAEGERYAFAPERRTERGPDLGYGEQDMGRASRVEGFDEELKRAGDGGGSGGESAVSRIRELMERAGR